MKSCLGFLRCAFVACSLLAVMGVEALQAQTTYVADAKLATGFNPEGASDELISLAGSIAVIFIIGAAMFVAGWKAVRLFRRTG